MLPSRHIAGGMLKRPRDVDRAMALLGDALCPRREQHDVEVPEYGQTPLALSGVSISSARATLLPTARADEKLQSILGGPPTTARAFAAGDTLTAYVELYGSDIGTARVDLETQVIGPDNKVVFRSHDEVNASQLQKGRLRPQDERAAQRARRHLSAAHRRDRAHGQRITHRARSAVHRRCSAGCTGRAVTLTTPGRDRHEPLDPLAVRDLARVDIPL